MSKWKRILISLGIVVLVCGAYIWFFGLQTFFIWQARRMARIDPALWMTPVALSDLSVSRAPGKKLSYFGYECEIPWDDIDSERTTVIGTKAIVAFHSGNAISFWSGPPNELTNNLLRDGTIDRNILAQLVGDETVQLDYAFHKAVLEIAPDKFSLLTPQRQVVRQGVLFTMKAVILPPSAKSGVFSLRTSEFEGYQYGRPQGSLRSVSVELFRSDGQVSILFGQQLNGATVISQADVNRVVQSVRRVPTQ